jgi:hypothetical protein
MLALMPMSLMERPLEEPKADAKASKNKVNSSTQPMCIVAPGQIHALFSTLVFSEEKRPMAIVVIKLLNQEVLRKPETNVALERMMMLFQLETVIPPNGPKDLLSIRSLILLSMNMFGSEILLEPGGSLPKMAKKILSASA